MLWPSELNRGFGVDVRINRLKFSLYVQSILHKLHGVSVESKQFKLINDILNGCKVLVWNCTTESAREQVHAVIVFTVTLRPMNRNLPRFFHSAHSLPFRRVPLRYEQNIRE
jgi:hypothetical protein